MKSRNSRQYSSRTKKSENRNDMNTWGIRITSSTEREKRKQDNVLKKVKEISRTERLF